MTDEEIGLTGGGLSDADIGLGNATEGQGGLAALASGIPLAGAYADKLVSLGSQLPGGNAVSPEDVKAAREGFEHRNPFTSLAGQVVAGTAALAPAGGMLGAGLKGVLAGAGLGGADAALRGQDPTLGAAVGGAAGPIGSKVGGAVSKLLPATRAAETTSGAVRSEAQKVYTALESDKTVIPSGPAAAQDVMDAIKVHPKLSDSTRGIVQDLVDHPAPTVSDFYATQKQLGDVFKGQPSSEWVAAGQARDSISKLIPALREADQNYAAASLADILQAKGAAAQVRASASHSGLNEANSIKGKLATWLSSGPGQRAPVDVREAVQQLIEGNVGSNTLRYVAKFLGGGGGLGALHAMTAGALAGGAPGAIAAPVAGYALTKLHNRQVGNQLKDVVQTALQRSPYAQTLPTIPLPSANGLLSGIGAGTGFGVLPNLPSLYPQGR